MINHPITLITPSPNISVLHFPPQTQQNVLLRCRYIIINCAYMFHLQPYPLHNIPTTVVTFSDIHNKFLLNPQIKV